ncbi:DNA repair protein [Micromonospora sp. STR1_7]|uniref:DNA repair protein n=2 Tax=Micromonospora parastrephiae TaxID=2806101 RepID=A0ABS1XQE6_9ACTN|nr:DNA repair protein [Micromonospora parastrephiae]
MPIQPNDRHQQDPERLWAAAEAVERLPAQPRHRGPRATGDANGMSWAALNKLRVGSSSRHGLNTH